MEHMSGKILSWPKTLLKPIYIQATSIPDAWFQCVYNILDPKKSRQRKIDKGSDKDKTRYEFDYIIVHMTHPGSRPLIPEMPIGKNIPPPVETMECVERHFVDIICRTNVPIEKIIKQYKKFGRCDNQLILDTRRPYGNPEDPPLLRLVHVKIIDNKLYFFPIFDSHELWYDLPINLAAIQLLKEMLAQEMDVEDGEMIYVSNALHICNFVKELAEMRTNL